ncbi:MAG: LacI family transcriptional regulator [Gemmatimonadaceae bacterium]|nr:LacI family transcriptional regulator [Gemmatimonadaceae bacterium]
MPKRIGPTKVTIKHVAERAGVSQPTASLVLSGHPKARIAAATRARVLEVARELGYQPNRVAQALARGRSYTIGVLVPDLHNPFFAEVISGVERVAAEAGYAVLLCEQTVVPAARHLDALRARQVDGLVIDAIGASELPDDALAGLNVVLVDEPPGERPGVASDALQAGALVAAHLLGLGHTRLAFIGPADAAWATRMRERGFAHALREAGVAISSARWRRVAPSIAGGQAAMRALLALPADQRPTAVFCANDLLALGAHKACALAGVRLPQDCSIVGCDDIEMARLVTPELSSVTVPARALGARAARLLLAEVDAPGQPARPRPPLAVALVARGSSGPAPTVAA